MLGIVKLARRDRGGGAGRLIEEGQGAHRRGVILGERDTLDGQVGAEVGHQGVAIRADRQ